MMNYSYVSMNIEYIHSQFFIQSLDQRGIIGEVYSIDLPKHSFHHLSDKDNFNRSIYPLSQEQKRTISYLGKDIMIKKILNHHHYKNHINDAKLVKEQAGIKCGKPYVIIHQKAGVHQLYSSISHSENVFAFGISENRPIGIDIERNNRLSASAIRHLLSESENKLINQYRNLDLITLFWTIKESLLKAIGCGFQFGFQSIVIQDIDLDNQRLIIGIHHKISQLFDGIIHHFSLLFTQNKPFTICISFSR